MNDRKKKRESEKTKRDKKEREGKKTGIMKDNTWLEYLHTKLKPSIMQRCSLVKKVLLALNEVASGFPRKDNNAGHVPVGVNQQLERLGKC